MSITSITTAHRERMAYVYVRQSTLWQVHEHQESTERQYRLQERALQLGWPPTALLSLMRIKDVRAEAQPPVQAFSVWWQRSAWGR